MDFKITGFLLRYRSNEYPRSLLPLVSLNPDATFRNRLLFNWYRSFFITHYGADGGRRTLC